MMRMIAARSRVLCRLSRAYGPLWYIPIAYIPRRYRATAVEPTINEENWDRGGKTKKNSLSPLYALSKKYMNDNPGSVCLIQVGSFYELYFDQAEIYGQKLGLKVAFRKTTNYSIPMAGFPTVQLQKYVKILVQDLKVNVAIIDQYPDVLNMENKIIHRKISRIVSPGTLVDETFMNYSENNYLLAISFPPNCTKVPYDPDMRIGLSWIDLSVGDFFVQETKLSELISDISRISPSEIVISKEFSGEDMGSWYSGLQNLKKYFIRYHNTIYNDLKLLFKNNINHVRKLVETLNVREEAAMNMILSYINVNLPERNPSLDLPTKYWSSRYLQMDSRTRDALELLERNSGTSGKNLTVGSLLNTIKRTSTTSGTRLLTEWLKSPILDTQELTYRQDFVKFYMSNPNHCIVIEEFLSNSVDYIRSAQRLALKTGDSVTHLKSIALGLKNAYDLKTYLQNNRPVDFVLLLDNFLADYHIPIELADRILDTFDYTDYVSEIYDDNKELSGFDESFHQEEYNNPTMFFVKKDFSLELNQLHQDLSVLREKELHMFNEIKGKAFEIDDKLNIQIKHQHNRFNDVIYISGKSKLITLVADLFNDCVKDKKKNMLLYKSNEWKKLQYDINDQIYRIREMENQIVNELRDKVVDAIVEIRKVNKLTDFLDVTLSFAKLSKEYNLTCPQFLKGNQLIIEGGRHIVVESSLRNIGSNFIHNDTYLKNETPIWVISGPNMGGKSTFLRQNAIIAIMAQIGCFVPAEKCKMGIVDKIFTRIGASDDLFNDLSTFMVEMVEVTNILNNATKRSLAIVDEVGRGTSGKEGLAIAYSTLVSLMKTNKCRTLFATHFGNELNDLLKKEGINQQKVNFMRTGVLEELVEINGRNRINLVMNHKLEQGISAKSYAIEVAQLSGFPKKGLEIARRALDLMK